MKKESIEALGLVLATLNLDDVYPSQRELLREILEDAKQTHHVAYKKGYADAMGWKTQNHLEHLPPAVCEQCPYLEIHDAVARDNDRALDLLRWAETEMRYAGWTKYEADNSARNGVYEQIKHFFGEHMTAQDLHDLNKFLMDLHFIQANSLVGAELQGNKQAIKYMKRIAELRELIKLEAKLKEKNNA